MKLKIPDHLRRVKLPSKKAPKEPKEKPPKEKRVRKAKKVAKPFKPSKAAKFALFIGDEGAILIYLKGGVVQSRQFVSDASEQSLDELRQTFGEDPNARLTVIVDSMDQSHVQQTLPPVSSLSVNKLIKKRLDRDFGPDTIKGAVPLGRDKSGRKDWHFMMVALENSPQFTVWLDFIAALPNRLVGIHMVSVETEILVKNLERGMGISPKEGTGAKWKFFVSHNKVGGFRQVILHNGHIIFTRLAQPVGDFNAEIIAGNIEQEILGTIEYLKRLSFNPGDGLDVYIVASSGIKPLIDKGKFGANSLQIFTPFEVAELLGIEGAAQPTDQFGDVILATVIGLSRKHILTLSTVLSKKINSLYQLMQMQRAGVALIVLGLIAYIGSGAFGMFEILAKISEASSTKQMQQQTLTSLQDDAKKTHLDIEQADDFIDLYNQLRSERTSPLPFIQQISPITQASIWFSAIDWAITSNTPNPAAAAAAAAAGTPATPPKPGQPTANGTTKTVLTLVFPKDAKGPKELTMIANKVQNVFKSLFPGATVEYTSLPAEMVGTKEIEIDFSNKAEEIQQSGGKSDIQLSITGPLIPMPVGPTPPTAAAPAPGTPPVPGNPGAVPPGGVAPPVPAPPTAPGG